MQDVSVRSWAKRAGFSTCACVCASAAVMLASTESAAQTLPPVREVASRRWPDALVGAPMPTTLSMLSPGQWWGARAGDVRRVDVSRRVTLGEWSARVLSFAEKKTGDDGTEVGAAMQHVGGGIMLGTGALLVVVGAILVVVNGASASHSLDALGWVVVAVGGGVATGGVVLMAF